MGRSRTSREFHTINSKIARIEIEIQELVLKLRAKPDRRVIDVATQIAYSRDLLQIAIYLEHALSYVEESGNLMKKVRDLRRGIIR